MPTYGLLALLLTLTSACASELDDPAFEGGDDKSDSLSVGELAGAFCNADDSAPWKRIKLYYDPEGLHGVFDKGIYSRVSRLYEESLDKGAVRIFEFGTYRANDTEIQFNMTSWSLWSDRTREFTEPLDFEEGSEVELWTYQLEDGTLLMEGEDMEGEDTRLLLHSDTATETGWCDLPF